MTRTTKDTTGDRMPSGRIPLGFGNLYASVGDHIGHFYQTDEECRNLLVPFLKTGLDAGDKCIVLIRPGARTRELKDALATVGADVVAAEASGQLRIFEGQPNVAELQETLKQALAETGDMYPLLRWVGDMTWAMGQLPTSAKLMEWESHCNVVEDASAVFLCQYDLTAFRGDVVMDALKTHPVCVVGPVLHQNPYYQEPGAFLADMRGREAAPLGSSSSPA